MPFRPEKLTVKAQEAVQSAQSYADAQGHPQLTPLHLLKALIDEEGGIVRPLLEKIGVNVAQIRGIVDSDLKKLPKQSGGQVSVGPAMMQVLNKAADTADQMQD